MKEAGKAVKEFRENAKVSQWQLAALLGTSQAVISDIEHNGIVSKKMAKKLAVMLNVDVEFFRKDK